MTATRLTHPILLPIRQSDGTVVKRIVNYDGDWSRCATPPKPGEQHVRIFTDDRREVVGVIQGTEETA